MRIMPYAEKFQILPRQKNGEDEYGNDVFVDGEPKDVWGAFDEISGRHPTGRIAGDSTATRGAAGVGGSEQTIEYDMVYLEQGSYMPGPFDHIIARGVRRGFAQLPTIYRNPFTGFSSGPVLTLRSVEG
jgi:hypothetical protein